jgi:hypothetical protein
MRVVGMVVRLAGREMSKRGCGAGWRAAVAVGPSSAPTTSSPDSADVTSLVGESVRRMV